MSTIIDVLIVDDEGDWRTRLAELVGRDQTIDYADSLETALSHLQKRFYYCALVDKKLKPGEGNDESGIQVLEAIANLGEGTKTMMLTSYSSVPSVVLALEDLKATGYVEKRNLGKKEVLERTQARIYNMISESKEDYSRRYGSGIVQLAAAVTSRQDKSIWEYNVISVIGKQGGYQALSDFLDLLLKEIPPLIPYTSGELPRIDEVTAIAEGEYWSKGLGESVRIRFGQRGVIDVEGKSLPSEAIVRHISHGPYGGLILRAGLQFENLQLKIKK